MIKVAIAGAAGRMGSSITRAVMNSDELTATCCFENPDSKHIGVDAGERAGVGMIGLPIEDSLKPGDYQVIIDFTTPRASVDIASFAAENQKSLVIGTTGFDEEQLESIRFHATKIPCVLSPNMSVGVNLLFYLVKRTVEILGIEYDCEIVESHHNKKKDAPSGTAKKIGEIISGIYKNDPEVSPKYGRYGFYPERVRGEVGIHSIRAGDIIGEHRVIFAGSEEVIGLEHRAGSRNSFALGALKAAKYVCDVSPGLYSMADVLNLPEI